MRFLLELTHVYLSICASVEWKTKISIYAAMVRIAMIFLVSGECKPTTSDIRLIYITFLNELL